MSVAGASQWFNISEINLGTNKDVCHQNGLGAITFENGFISTSKTVTAGPTTTGPIIVSVNSEFWAIPFNTAVSLPDYVWQCFVTTANGGPWTVA